MAKGIVRIDNLFFNTGDVGGLARWYASVTGIPIRRSQVEMDELMWCEIGVGGMELSFRRAGGAESRHAEVRGAFAELAPGAGATVSYEVDDTAWAREKLLSLGARPCGPTMVCTDGHELITAYRDPAGVIFQTYEARFDTPDQAISVTKRASSVVASDFGLNIRDIRGLGLGVTIRSPDPAVTAAFLVDAMGAEPAENGQGTTTLSLDRAILTVSESQADGVSAAVPAIEVASLDAAGTYLERTGFEFIRSEPRDEFRGTPIVGSMRLTDPDGNAFELWQRSA
jgi:catechol 2,3-dioxygenase-like lactoylglutathione lyase family enzyme